MLGSSSAQKKRAAPLRCAPCGVTDPARGVILEAPGRGTPVLPNKELVKDSVACTNDSTYMNWLSNYSSYALTIPLSPG